MIKVNVADFTVGIFTVITKILYMTYKFLLQAAYQYVTQYVIIPDLPKYYLKERCSF
jgi:hypothetical protein